MDQTEIPSMNLWRCSVVINNDLSNWAEHWSSIAPGMQKETT